MGLLCGEELFVYFICTRLLYVSFFQRGFKVTKKVFKLDFEELQKSELGQMVIIIRHSC